MWREIKMKKTKLLIGTLVLSMGLMGTGYAYWTKQLTVDTTVSSANFDVYLTNVTGEKVAEIGVDNTHNIVGATLRDSATNQVATEGDQLTYTWDNIYPGSKVQLSYTIVSKSTIPVEANPVYTLSNESNTTLAEALKFTVNGVDYQGFKAFAAAMQSKAVKLEKASIATPTQQQYTVIVSLDKTVTDVKTINQSFGFSVGMLWKQFNDVATVEPNLALIP